MLLRAARFTFHAWINPCSVFATFVTEGNLGSCAEMRPLIFNQQLLASKFDLSNENRREMSIRGKRCNHEYAILDSWRLILLIRISFYSIMIYRDDSFLLQLVISYDSAIKKKVRINRKCIINNEVHVTVSVNNCLVYRNKVSHYSLQGFSKYILLRLNVTLISDLSKHDRLFDSYWWLKFVRWHILNDDLLYTIITFLQM